MACVLAPCRPSKASHLFGPPVGARPQLLRRVFWAHCLCRGGHRTSTGAQSGELSRLGCVGRVADATFPPRWQGDDYRRQGPLEALRPSPLAVGTAGARIHQRGLPPLPKQKAPTRSGGAGILTLKGGPLTTC